MIEAVPEIPDVKIKLYQQMADLLPAHSIIATNSSTLLPSQFAILEPLQPDENGVEVSIEGSVEEMVERAVAAVNEYAAKAAAQSQQAE